MRILLINPFYPLSETPSPPLGLAYLAAVLEREGFEVEILDFVVFPYRKEALETRMKKFQPDVVGLTSVTMNFHKAVEILNDARDIDPEIFTVMGGCHVTFCPEDTLRAVPELDCVAIGEGEITILELVNALSKDRGLAQVEGIAYRDGTEIINNGRRKQAMDMDTLPLPARHLLPMGRYRALGLCVTMTTSRACPHSCIFCVGRKMFGSRVRFRNPDMVLDEFESLSRLNYYLISLADDLFTAKKSRCLYICDEILRRGLKQRWSSFARVDTVTPELLARMREAGCTDICFGIETGNQDILNTIKKGTTLEQAVEATKMCRDVGIKPLASFIIGLPGETPETLQQTVDFGLKLNSLGARYGFHLLSPFPGTEIREQCEKYGIKILTNDWSRYHANRAVVETAAVSSEMFNNTVIEWEQRVDGWNQIIRDRIKEGFGLESDIQRLEDDDRKECVDQLMMSRAIETRGCWPNGNKPMPDDEALKTLVERLDGYTNQAPEDVYRRLKHVMTQHDLRCVQADGQTRWEWVDYLS